MDIPKESPFLNLVERFHELVKDVAKKSNISIENATKKLNDLPLSKLPACLRAAERTISPSVLFHSNNKKLLEQVCDFLKQQSGRRKLRSETLRGNNIIKFQRFFEPGQVIKFPLGNGKLRKIGFAVVTARDGKMYRCKRIGANRNHFLHAQQMERIMLSEKFLEQILSGSDFSNETDAQNN